MSVSSVWTRTQSRCRTATCFAKNMGVTGYFGTRLDMRHKHGMFAPECSCWRIEFGSINIDFLFKTHNFFILSRRSLGDAVQNLDGEDDKDILIGSVGPPECRRFYILAVFSLASAIQGLLWMTYSSVPQQASQVVICFLCDVLCHLVNRI